MHYTSSLSKVKRILDAMQVQLQGVVFFSPPVELRDPLDLD